MRIRGETWKLAKWNFICERINLQWRRIAGRCNDHSISSEKWIRLPRSSRCTRCVEPSSEVARVDDNTVIAKLHGNVVYYTCICITFRIRALSTRTDPSERVNNRISSETLAILRKFLESSDRLISRTGWRYRDITRAMEIVDPNSHGERERESEREREGGREEENPRRKQRVTPVPGQWYVWFG